VAGRLIWRYTKLLSREVRDMRVRRLLLVVFATTAVASIVILIVHYNEALYNSILGVSRVESTANDERVVKRSFQSERLRVLQKAKNDLSSPDVDTRRRAVYIFSELDGKELIEHLFSHTLKEEESQVLGPLLNLIGAWGDKSMVPCLIEMKYRKYKGYNYKDHRSKYMGSAIEDAIKRIRARAEEGLEE